MKEYFNEIRTVPEELKNEFNLYWMKAYKSSDFPVDTNKEYFCRYNVEGEEGIYWGDMDDLYLTNFKERGKFLVNN